MKGPIPQKRRLLGAFLGPVIAALAIVLLQHRSRLPAPEARPSPTPLASRSASESRANPPAPPASPGVAGPVLKESTVRQLQVIDEIFASRNDNDPRMDTELRTLDDEAKAALRSKYRALPREKLNERGTLVFLLGRNLSKPADIDFLREVLSEPACLSPDDCTRPMPPMEGEGEHHSGSVAIVLAYPQLNAIKALEKAPRSPELRGPTREAWAAARESGSTLVSGYARKISTASGRSSR